MIHYIYDGTFQGFLTAVADALKNQDGDIKISTGNERQLDFFVESVSIATQPETAESLINYLKSNLTREIVTDIAYCFLSEVDGIETTIYHYIRLIFEKGKGMSRNYSDDAISKVRRTSDQVDHEILRFQGFVRFRKLQNNLYYATIEPDHNILEMLAPHFSDRFADQQWVIHDLKRKIAIFYNGCHCRFIPFIENELNQTGNHNSDFSLTNFSYDLKEPDYQSLWEQYFKNIAITERKNPTLQRQRLPKRYWKHLVEKVEE